ncbi:MAG: YgaP-like transmembrane domain [Ignavibacteriales bacterium]
MENIVASVQRIMKIVIGLAMLSYFFIGEGDGRYMALIGLAPLISGITNSCGGSTACRTDFRTKE